MEHPLRALALVGGADGAAGADGCAWTAYAGGAPALLLSRLRGGAASLRAKVDHAGFTIPRYDSYGPPKASRATRLARPIPALLLPCEVRIGKSNNIYRFYASQAFCFLLRPHTAGELYVSADVLTICV